MAERSGPMDPQAAPRAGDGSVAAGSRSKSPGGEEGPRDGDSRAVARPGEDEIAPPARDEPAPPAERDDPIAVAGTRVARQLRFVLEIDRLKGVLRQTLLTDASRRENSAEHSWHLGIMAQLLAEYAPSGVEPGRVVRMVLVHDIVEIDAGDAFCYDSEAVRGKEERERLAAERIFGLLPSPQGEDLRGLWQEFEEGTTVDARYANALDRLQPLLHNFRTNGGTWRLHGITYDQVLERMLPVREGAPALWPVVLAVLGRSRERGWLVG